MASQAENDILAVLPPTGTIPYHEVRNALTTAGKSKSLSALHSARRHGVIDAVTIENVLQVGRPGQGKLAKERARSQAANPARPTNPVG